MRIHFIITVHHEPADQLAWCARHLRTAYPNALVSVIADGRDKPSWRDECNCYGLNYQPRPERLKSLHQGARWWNRFFELALQYETEYVVKLDPDSLFRRPFVSFPDFDLCGTLQDDGVVQGGCQVFSSEAVSRIAKSKLCLDPAYCNPETWSLHSATTQYAISRGEMSTDYTLAHISRRLMLNVGDWSEIDSQWTPRPRFRKYGVSVSHPHKIPSLIASKR
jgi:hypothetical protein